MRTGKRKVAGGLTDWLTYFPHKIALQGHCDDKIVKLTLICCLQLGTSTPDRKFRMFTKEEIETLVQEIK